MMNGRTAWIIKLALLAAIAGAMHGPRRAEADGPLPVALNVPAPELVGRDWRNTPGNAPLTLAAQRGKVTILHFWTFG